MMLSGIHIAVHNSAIAQVSCSGELPSDESTRIEYLGHASFRFTDAEGLKVIIDPYQNHRWIGYGFPQAITADKYVVTHPHYDHNAVPADAPSDDVIKEPGSYEVGRFSVTGFSGRHAKKYGKRFKHKNTMFLFENAGLRWLHVGDNGPITEEFLSNIQPIHILFLPIDDEGHLLTSDEVASIRKHLKPKVTIPMHYRLNEYETNPKKPEDLGDLSNFIKTEEQYEELTSYCVDVSLQAMPRTSGSWILKPHPDIQR